METTDNQKDIQEESNNNRSNQNNLAVAFINYLEEQLNILNKQLELTSSSLTGKDSLASQETASLRGRIFDINTHLNVIKQMTLIDS